MSRHTNVARLMLLIPMLLVFSLVAAPASAGAPQCYPWQNTGYCQYNGKVREAYVNAYDQVILYFDADVNPANAAAVGLTGVTVTSAAMFSMSTNKDFGKMLFAALLSAQARGAEISVQMLTVNGGYLVIDRIWVKE